MDGSDRLSALRRRLRDALGGERFELWFSAGTELAADEHGVCVRFASAAEMTFVRRRLDPALQAICRDLWGAEAHVEYQSHEAADGDAAITGSPRSAARVVAAAQRIDAAQGEQRAPAGDQPPAEFFGGSSNALVVEATRRAVQQPGRCTPVWLVGPAGCGKTTLLAATAWQIRRRRDRRRVLHLTCEEFTARFLEALQRRDLPGFRHKMRSVDVLLLDELQFLQAKKATISEAAYTIDAVQARGGQVILASDRGGAELDASCAELVARAAAGLVATIGPPEAQVRRAIAAQCAKRIGQPLTEDVLSLVARDVVGSGRLVCGAVHRLATAAAASGTPLTVEFAAAELADFNRLHGPQVGLADIQRAVCEVFGVESNRLKSPSRQRAVAEPRMLAMWLARRYTRAALSEIGDFFGRRSHSTVVSAQQRCDRLVGASGQIRLGDSECPIDDAMRRVEAALRVS